MLCSLFRLLMFFIVRLVSLHNICWRFTANETLHIFSLFFVAMRKYKILHYQFKFSFPQIRDLLVVNLIISWKTRFQEHHLNESKLCMWQICVLPWKVVITKCGTLFLKLDSSKREYNILQYRNNAPKLSFTDFIKYL